VRDWRLHNLGPHMPAHPHSSTCRSSVGAVYGVVQAQSARLSFNDIYWVIAIAIRSSESAVPVATQFETRRPLRDRAL
jgi:hypothetical protein